MATPSRGIGTGQGRSYYSAEVLVAFIDEHREMVKTFEGQHAEINGVWVSKLDRTRLSDWRRQNGVSLETTDDFLRAHDLTLDEFEAWAEASGLDWRGPAMAGGTLPVGC